MRKFLLVSGFTLLSGFLLLAAKSRYTLPQGHKVTFETVLLLTPYGIAKNFFVEPDHPFRHVYFLPANRPDIEDPFIQLGVALTSLGGILCLACYRKDIA